MSLLGCCCVSVAYIALPKGILQRVINHGHQSSLSPLDCCVSEEFSKGIPTLESITSLSLLDCSWISVAFAKGIIPTLDSNT